MLKIEQDFGKIFAFGASTLCIIVVATFIVVSHYKFTIGCRDHLKRAADANTVKTARVELRTAIAYLQVKGLTDGYVSIFLKQPKNDIGFWFKNLTESFEELESVPDSSSHLEKSNVLMKLRETILDETESGTRVTHPKWISLHPHNGTYLFLLLVLGATWFISGCRIWAKIDNPY